MLLLRVTPKHTQILITDFLFCSPSVVLLHSNCANCVIEWIYLPRPPQKGPVQCSVHSPFYISEEPETKLLCQKNWPVTVFHTQIAPILNLRSARVFPLVFVYSVSTNCDLFVDTLPAFRPAEFAWHMYWDLKVKN